MAATGRAIGQHGPARLTLAVVGVETGLAAATLVQRYGSKRGLLLAFAQTATPAVRAAFQSARAAHDDPLAALLAALALMGEGVRTPAELANHLGFLQMDLTDPDFRTHALAQARQLRLEIVRQVRAAVAAGQLDPTVNAATLARLVQTTYNGALIGWALAGRGALPAAIRGELADLLRPYRR